jgi:hypothetical protein
MFSNSVLVTAFSEHPVANPSKKEVHPLDVIQVDTAAQPMGESATSNYCTALLNKLFSLANLQIMPFFKYQCSLVEDPKAWLTNLQTLLENNLHLFTTWQTRMKMEMILVHIAIMYQEVENGKFKRIRKYDINEVKKTLKSIKSTMEQLDFLYNLKTEFLQDKFKVVDFNEMPFDQLLLIEIERIEQFRASIDKIKGKTTLSKNSLSDHYIDNNEFIIKMNISKRTAQLWRDKGLIKFIQIGAKIYYKLPDVEQMLQQNYKKPSSSS